MDRKEFVEKIYETVSNVCGNDNRFLIEKNYDDKAVHMGLSYYYQTIVWRVSDGKKVEVAAFCNPDVWSECVTVRCYAPHTFLKGNLEDVLNGISSFLKERISLFS